MKLSLLSFVPVLFLYSSANAANLFVSTDGTGMSCVKEEPCASIQMAVDQAQPGDNIHVGKGTYVENVHLGSPTTPNTHPGITISGEGRDETLVVSAGISSQRPAGVLADIVFDVWSADVTIEKLSIKHPVGEPLGRDIGVFVSPHGKNVTVRKCNIIRNRTGLNLEPTAPGSRGVLVLRAKDTVITKNHFSGNYEDHIHMPTGQAEITKNNVSGATRLGIVIIQENATSDSTGNIIAKNTVRNSGADGIQIQGDNNVISKNKLENNTGADIKLCGIDEVGDCVNPFDAWSEASENIIQKNSADSIVDNGSNNLFYKNKTDGE